MYYGGESNVPGAPGNVAAVNPGGIPNRPVDPELLKRLQQQGTPPPPGFREQYGLPPAPQPGSGPQLPMAMNSSQGFPPMGNAGFLATTPQGPYTPLPAPGWNPGMIKPPGDPNFRPSPQMERIGPTGQPVPWQAAGFQNKFVS